MLTTAQLSAAQLDAMEAYYKKWCIADVQALISDLRAARSLSSQLLGELENLFAMVQGECPSLLEDHHQWDSITAAIEKAKAEELMPRPSTGHPSETWRCNICGGLVRFDGTPPALDQPKRGPKQEPTP